jgi:hypothetical protein
MTRGYIPFEDFVDLAPTELEEQVHVNHDNCTSGVDTKRRLYIRRSSDGAILAWCHNCQQKGVYKGNLRKGRNLPRSRDVLLARRYSEDYHEYRQDKRKTASLPWDYTTDTSKFPAAALVWLYKSRLTSQDIRRYGIGYSERLGRVIIPVYGRDGKFHSWQGRYVHDDNVEQPKYINFTGSNKTDGLFLCRRPSREADEGARGTSKTLFLVEDALSAIRISEFEDALALLGVTLGFGNLTYLLKHYDRFVIFLDDDNPTVKKQGINLLKTLRNHVGFNNVSVVHTNGKDPKEFNKAELKELIKEYT